MAIKTWSCDDSRRVFEGENVRQWSRQVGRAAERKLKMIHASVSVDDLKVPRGNRLEKLKPKKDNRWSIRINDQWRIVFVWREGNAYQVAIVDYH